MTAILAATFAAGTLLVAAPWLWPARATEAPSGAPDAVVRLLESAGYAGVQPRVVMVLSAVGALVAAAAAWLVTSVVVFAVLVALAAAALPFLWLRGRRMRMLRTRRAMWPDVCDLLIASVRAGMSLSDSVAGLASSAPTELRPAFAAFGRDVVASGHFESSILRLKTTLSDPTADRIIEILRMARHVGGTELTAVLRSLATSVRTEAALRSEVEARQSWIRGAAVLGVVAPWVILVLLALRPEGSRAYGSPEGIGLTVAGAVVSVIAFRLMLRIGRLPEPRRWFG